MDFLKKLIKLPFIGLIKFYQIAISPAFGPGCRHYPTCSNYAIEAISIHGIFKGLWLSFKRVIRCNRWGTFGFDPVPPGKENKKTV